MGDVAVVDLLVEVEHLVDAHCDELDILNVFPVPDADTGRNVLATVRAARVAAEQAPPGQRRRAAVVGALHGARGNAGALTSQLLRALVEDTGDGADGWPARLARADELCRGAVAHPVEGSLLTAVRAAATAAAGHDDPAAQLAAAVAAAHAAVRDSPTQLAVLARAGVVDAGARAAALVLEAVAAVHGGTVPVPPAVELPPGGPDVADCPVDDAPFEVMYLLDPEGADGAEVTAAVRSGLDRIGGSVVVVEADRLVSVHVHTDDIGAALDVGLAHGRPHHVRVEDLQQGQRDAAARGPTASAAIATTGRVGLVVGTAGAGIARLAGELGAITLPLVATPTAQDVRAAVGRTGAARVVVLPGDARLADVARGLATGDVTVEVAGAVHDPARVVAALAVLDPADVDVALLEEVAAGVRSGVVRPGTDQSWTAAVGPDTRDTATATAAVAALLALLDHDGAPPELVTVLLGADVGVALRDEIAAVVEQHFGDADVELVDAELVDATVVVGVE